MKANNEYVVIGQTESGESLVAPVNDTKNKEQSENFRFKATEDGIVLQAKCYGSFDPDEYQWLTVPFVP